MSAAGIRQLGHALIEVHKNKSHTHLLHFPAWFMVWLFYAVTRAKGGTALQSLIECRFSASIISGTLLPLSITAEKT